MGKLYRLFDFMPLQKNRPMQHHTLVEKNCMMIGMSTVKDGFDVVNMRAPDKERKKVALTK